MKEKFVKVHFCYSSAAVNTSPCGFSGGRSSRPIVQSPSTVLSVMSREFQFSLSDLPYFPNYKQPCGLYSGAFFAKKKALGSFFFSVLQRIMGSTLFLVEATHCQLRGGTLKTFINLLGQVTAVMDERYIILLRSHSTINSMDYICNQQFNRQNNIDSKTRFWCQAGS